MFKKCFYVFLRLVISRNEYLLPNPLNGLSDQNPQTSERCEAQSLARPSNALFG